MYRGQRLARMLMEKEEMDELLMNTDRSEWYNVNGSALPASMMNSFHQFFYDPDAQHFLQQSLETSNSLCLQFYYALASTLLSFIFSKTSINGILGRGGMFIFSNEQFRDFLNLPAEWDRRDKRLLDLGAGDGQVTSVLSEFYGTVSVTEASQVMEWRLQQRGFNLVDKDTWSMSGTYDLVSALNLLDRHYDPHALLSDLHGLASRSNCLLLIAVVLPLRQYVEFHPHSKSTNPDTVVTVKGTTFEQQAASLVEDIFTPAGFELVKWGKLPYLCEGDHQQAYYHLNDAIFLLRPILRTQPYETVRLDPVTRGADREREAL